MRFKQIMLPIVALGLMTAPVLAQQPVPGATTGNATATAQLTIEDARRIARENGMKTVKEIELDDGRWEVEGRDGTGREMEIEIHARTGAVLKIEYD
ncbi:MAG: PepSY domain-containing protein [Pseudolabrys sp.]|nr:PepSY domain-containing protein [Pseudolabrys sp.]